MPSGMPKMTAEHILKCVLILKNVFSDYPESLNAGNDTDHQNHAFTACNGGMI